MPSPPPFLLSKKSARLSPSSILEGPTTRNWPSIPIRLNPDILPWMFEHLVGDNGNTKKLSGNADPKSTISSTSIWVKLHLLHAIGAMAAGNVISPKQIVDSVVVTECLAKTASEEDENEEPSETEARGRPPTNEDPQYLASMALIMLCVKLHFEHPSEFVPEVRNGLTFLLKNLILCLPEERASAASLVEPHGGPPHPWDQRQRNLSTAALSAIHAILWLRSDRSFLQSSLLHSFNSQSFVFLKILTVIKSAKLNSTRGLGQGAEVGEQQDSISSRVQVRETVVLALNVLTSIFKHSSLTKDVFAQLVGFSRLLS